MKRFVTYLYLYDGRIKGNNAGFIKVEINGEKSPEKEKCIWYMKRKNP